MFLLLLLNLIRFSFINIQNFMVWKYQKLFFIYPKKSWSLHDFIRNCSLSSAVFYCFEKQIFFVILFYYTKTKNSPFEFQGGKKFLERKITCLCKFFPLKICVAKYNKSLRYFMLKFCFLQSFEIYLLNLVKMVQDLYMFFLV